MPETRSLTAQDIPALGKLLNDIFRRQQKVFDQNVLADFPLVFVPENFRNCRVLLENDQIVSHAAIFPCNWVVGDARLKTGVIILVATDNACRKRGYAADLMRELQQIMHEDDYDLGLLWTGVPEFYEKLGWEVVVPRGWMTGDLREQPDLFVNFSNDDAEGRNIETYDEKLHLDDIIRIHDREAIRVERSRHEYATLLSLPKITVFVLTRNNNVDAYIVVGQAVNKRGVIEYGGGAADIRALIHHVQQTHDLNRELPLLIYYVRDDLRALIDRSGQKLDKLECSKGRGFEMIYVVKPERLTDEFRDRQFSWGLDFT